LESGIPNAIKVFEELRRKGHKPVGIRLDSGDLAYLSIQAAKRLNEAGFPEASITLSNELDELSLWQILTQIEEEAPRHGIDYNDLIKRLVYGVGTRLITSAGDPALGGVYKLVAVWNENQWVPAIKISETAGKIPNPANKQVWRIYDQRRKATADLICLNDETPREMDRMTLRHPTDHSKRRILHRHEAVEIEPLLIEIWREGKLVYDLPSINVMREIRKADVERLDAGVKRLMNPHIYHVSLSQRLWDLKQELIHSVQKNNEVN
jgi:nicotinate phosphoribosyltransferase